MEDTTDSTPENVQISVSFVNLIKEAQQQHGLRHQDYQRYRQYLTRKLGRLRKSMNILYGDKRRVVVRKMLPQNVTEPRHLSLSLFETERCWAYAMQLKAEANTEQRKKYHMVSRLRKAVTYAEELKNLCEVVGDGGTKLEATAYYLWMNGSLHFECESWKQAKENFEAAFKIYSSLAEVESLEEGIRELYLQRAEDVRPQLRYCAYNIGDTGAVEELRAMRRGAQDDGAVQQLDALLAQTRSATAAGTREVKWLGQSIVVRHEKARMFLDLLDEIEQQLKEAETDELKLSVYESLLKECTEVIGAVRDENRANADNKLNTLYCYLQFVKLYRTVERNLLLLAVHTKKNSKQTSQKSSRVPEAAARLHDTVVQNVQEIAQLTGVAEYQPLADSTKIAITYHKAQRAYHLALAYGSGRKYTECVGLLGRAQKHCNLVQDLISGSKKLEKIEALKIENSQVKNLLKEAEADELSYRAAALLGDEEDRTDAPLRDTRMLLQRLEIYQEDRSALIGKNPKSLVAFPPEFEPIPAKPLFFDLAFNSVQFPSLEAEVAAPGSRAAAGGGLTGFVRGWLPWGGKK